MPTPISAQVFPAYAGMFRIVWKARLMLVSFPRIRGDVPLSPSLAQVCVRFSPHTRGCSYCRSWRYRGGRVFPAYAGMFPITLALLRNPPGFPRIRGDVPMKVPQGAGRREFSPHTRGCSCDPTCGQKPWAVFPAYAGMFLEDHLIGL